MGQEREVWAADDDPAVNAGGGGLSWSLDIDLSPVIDALNGPAPWLRAVGDEGGAGAAGGSGAGGGSGAECAELDDAASYLTALEAGPVPELPLGFVAGRVAESLPVGPGLACWLAQTSAHDLEDGALAGVAASFRRLASWAAAGELAVVAQLAARSAEADRRASVGEDGRPDRVTSDAAAQVALALAMSHDGASSWADLGVALTWRLPATGAALAAGQIDLPRARMIARVAAPLSDSAARQVEESVLGRASWLTLGQLHAALRRAVIKADPDGAERRREEAERHAKIVLYPEDEGTATLAGYALPGVHAAAALARITALAKSMQAAGNSAGIDLVRAQVFIGLLLGTLPNVPPDSNGWGPDGPGSDGPDDPGPGEHDAGCPTAGRPAPDRPAPGGPAPDRPVPGDPVPDRPAPGGPVPGGPASGGPASGRRAPGSKAADDPRPGDPAADRPAGGRPVRDDPPGRRTGQSKDQSWPGRPWPWPRVPRAVGVGGSLARDGPAAGRSGLLKLTVPFATLAGASSEPGKVSRLGLITAEQARHLAGLAVQHPATRWRVVVARSGEAIALVKLPKSLGEELRGDAVGDTAGGLIGQVTVVIDAETLGSGEWLLQSGGPPPQGTSPEDGLVAGGLPPEPAFARILDRVWSAAGAAVERATEVSRADAEAGGCAHKLASVAYRPPPRIAELVVARDGTCRFPPCRRPAEMCDLDHVVPFDQGGLTCSCNLGGQCRSHHQLKQHPGWKLTQPVPGVFRWTTPAGRSYTIRPDPQLAA